MPFSKFDPQRPVDPDEARSATTPQAARRAFILKWANWITLAMTALGYGLLVWWGVRQT